MKTRENLNSAELLMKHYLSLSREEQLEFVSKLIDHIVDKRLKNYGERYRKR